MTHWSAEGILPSLISKQQAKVCFYNCKCLPSPRISGRKLSLTRWNPYVSRSNSENSCASQNVLDRCEQRFVCLNTILNSKLASNFVNATFVHVANSKNFLSKTACFRSTCKSVLRANCDKLSKFRVLKR